MRDRDHKTFSRLVQAHGCIASAAAELGESEPMVKRRCSGSTNASPSDFFALEAATGQYLLTRERMRDVLRTARDRGAPIKQTERVARDLRVILDFLEQDRKTDQ